MKKITNLIGNMNINLKLGLMIGLPLVGMLILTGMQGYEAWDRASRLDMLQKSAGINVKIGALVHEMQKERGASAGFLGSKGAKFGGILKTQRSATNKALSALTDALGSFDFTSMTAEGASGVRTYMRDLEALQSKRSQVDDMSISVADQVAWYTHMNHEGLVVIAEEAHGAYDPKLSVSADLSLMAAGYYTFLESKERAGIERAVVSGAFAMDRLSGKKRDKVMNLISAQKGYMNVFLSLSEDDSIEAYNRIMDKPETASAVASVQKMRHLILSKGSGYGVDAEHWFKTITTKINGLHVVESALASDFVRESQASADAAMAKFRSVILVSIGLLVLIGLLAVTISRGITRPLKETMDLLPALAEGDLTRRTSIHTHDEIGHMSDNLARAMDNLQETIKAIAGNAQTLAGASEEMTSVSQQMGANAEETSAQADVVSGASEQINSNIQTVAAGIEELSASAKEIAGNAAEAATVAETAVESASVANATIAKLDQSSSEIGEIINSITSIAQQTRLLALNATIEAARAGEAGKGFAVVANEVKDLAMETAKASDDISQKIEAIQADSKDAVSAIGQISDIITRINEFQTTIASAVEQQSGTANEIAQNVNVAAKGSIEISQNISGVAEAAQSTSTGANDTQQAAGELSRMASELQQLVGKFKYA